LTSGPPCCLRPLASSIVYAQKGLLWRPFGGLLGHRSDYDPRRCSSNNERPPPSPTARPTFRTYMKRAIPSPDASTHPRSSRSPVMRQLSSSGGPTFRHSDLARRRFQGRLNLARSGPPASLPLSGGMQHPHSGLRPISNRSCNLCIWDARLPPILRHQRTALTPFRRPDCPSRWC